MKPYIKNRLWIVITAIVLIFIYKTDFSQQFGRLYNVLAPVIIAFLFAWFLVPAKELLESLLKKKGNNFFKKHAHVMSAAAVYLVFMGMIAFFIVCLIPVIRNGKVNAGGQIENYRYMMEKYISSETIN